MDIQVLAQKMMEDSEKWFPTAFADLTVIALGMNGEAGEVADIVKKIARGSTTVQAELDHLREECIDVLIYTLCCLQLLRADIEMEYLKKREYNLMRFGNQNGSS